MDALAWLEGQSDASQLLILMQNLLHCVHDPLLIMELAYQKLEPGGYLLFNLKSANYRFTNKFSSEQLTELVNSQIREGCMLTHDWAEVQNPLFYTTHGYIQVTESKPLLQVRQYFSTT